MDKYDIFMKLKKLVSVLSFSLFLSINSFCPVKASTNEPVAAAKRENEKVYRQSTSAVERLSSLESLSKIGIIVKDEDILPVHIELNSYLYLDTQGKALVGDRISEYAIYCPMTDFDIQVLSVMIITKDDQFEHHKYELEPHLFEYFHSRMTLPNPEKTSEYCHNLNLQFYHMDRHPYQETTNGPLRSPTYNVDYYYEENLSKMTGLTNEFKKEADFNDVSPLYVDDNYIKISFDDNPIVNFIPKRYFQKPTTKTYLGQEYGFYINTVAVNANKNRSEFFLFKMQHTRGRAKAMLNGEINQDNTIDSGTYSFELRPMVQGRIFYFKQNDMVTGIIPTNNFCIENPTYVLSTNNMNGSYNDLPDMLSMGDENKSCFVQEYRSKICGQTLSYKSYSPILEYTKEFTSFMNSIPSPDPVSKFITEAADSIVNTLKLTYDWWQSNITENYKNTINFSRDTNTNKLTSSYRINLGNSQNLDLTNATKKTDARRGYAVSLSNQDGVYDGDNYPILYKDCKDEFLVDFNIKANRNTQCFAQNVVTKLSFNLKKDETILLGKHTADLIESSDRMQKYWLMSYDPCGEYEGNSKIKIGETYFTDVPHEGGQKTYRFTPEETKTYEIKTVNEMGGQAYFTITQNGRAVNSSYGQQKNGYYRSIYYLQEGLEYKISFKTFNPQSNSTICNFRIDEDMGSISPLAINSKSSSQFEMHGCNSKLYGFKTPNTGLNKEPYLLQTMGVDKFDDPDTYLELLDENFNPIMYSNMPLSPFGDRYKQASIIMALSPNKQYYVSVQLRAIYDDDDEDEVVESIRFRVVRERELGWYDFERPMNYDFSLNKDCPMICYHILSLAEGRRNFIISGNNINLIDFDLQDTFGNSIAPVEKRSSTSGELMISYDFVKPYTYFLFIYSKSPTNVPTNNFRLHH